MKHIKSEDTNHQSSIMDVISSVSISHRSSFNDYSYEQLTVVVRRTCFHCKFVLHIVLTFCIM